MEDISVFYRFGISLAAGFLVGLQREFTFARDGVQGAAAGVRTFAIVGILGCSAALLSDILQNSAPLVAFLMGLSLLVGIKHHHEALQGKSGLTTDMSLLGTGMIGAIVWWGYLSLGVALAVLLTGLLSLKMEMHGFARRMTREDLLATLKFATISAIVLPLLPDQAYGPPNLEVFNPFKVWLLVVFISAISFLGYLLIKLTGPSRGIGITSVLGGIASSTALTLSFTARSRDNPAYAPTLALGVLVAWMVMFLRVLLIVQVLAPGLREKLILPLLAPVIGGGIWCLVLYVRQRSERHANHPEYANPFELLPAVKFGLLFTLVLLVSRAAQVYLGDRGLLASSFIAGLADVDAIVLSVAQLASGADALASVVAVQAIVLAGLANTLSKGILVVAAGSPGMRKAMAPGIAFMLAGGVLGLLAV